MLAITNQDVPLNTTRNTLQINIKEILFVLMIDECIFYKVNSSDWFHNRRMFRISKFDNFIDKSKFGSHDIRKEYLELAIKN